MKRNPAQRVAPFFVLLSVAWLCACSNGATDLVTVASVTVSPDTIELEVGETGFLSAEMRDHQGNVLSDRAVNWSSSNESLVTVSDDGVVTGVGAGYVTITATSEGQTAAAAATVYTGVSGMITSDATWGSGGSPYRLNGGLEIAEGVTLAIEPGVRISGEGHTILVWGEFRAVGNATDSVHIENLHIAPLWERSPTWSAPLIQIRYARFSGGALYSATGPVWGELLLQDSEILDLEEVVFLGSSTGRIERNVFLRSAGIFVNLFDPVRVRNNTFEDWSGNGTEVFAVQIWGSSADAADSFIEHNSFLSTDRIAVRLGYGVEAEILDAPNNYWGTTNESVVQSMIYDRNDDGDLVGVIEYEPILSSPHPDTPSL